MHVNETYMYKNVCMYMYCHWGSNYQEGGLGSHYQEGGLGSHYPVEYYLIPPQFWACSKPGLGFPKPYVDI